MGTFLCDLFLAACGRKIQEMVKDPRVSVIFRYVDDFLILCKTEVDEENTECRESVMSSFQQSCFGLLFTYELPVDKSIRFLDLALTFTVGHVCWRYQARSCKGFLPFDSGHSKNVKQSVATTVLTAALRKSCSHQVGRSFQTQISRLQAAGYPNALLIATCEKICNSIKRNPGEEGQTKKNTRQPIVIAPYIHGITHRLKKIAGRQGVHVVCSAPNKAHSMCRRVNQEGNSKGEVCGIAHRTKYATCEKGVIYNIPLSCGRSYIGQTGRCINDRAREHAASLRNISAGGHLSAHCRECRCTDTFFFFFIDGQSFKDLTRNFFLFLPRILMSFKLAVHRHVSSC